MHRHTKSCNGYNDTHFDTYLDKAVGYMVEAAKGADMFVWVSIEAS